jgi:hypothetical protein
MVADEAGLVDGLTPLSPEEEAEMIRLYGDPAEREYSCSVA